ncbi:MAG TPA: strawberry notch C-terminal domain-containing protein, partial [Devosia sp.]|nr:strawberry notch C-terminal domain-containing protein [Devosia sp.]
DGCSLHRFEDATGLRLIDSGTGGLKDELPPITTFLNRMLALPIDLQNILFTVFEELLVARIEGAIASGTYEVGLETLTAESFRITDRRIIYTHPGTGAETSLLTIERQDRNRPVTLDEALFRRREQGAALMVNSRSGRAAVRVPTRSLLLDDGTLERRVRLVRPTESTAVPLDKMPSTHWQEVDRETFTAAWEAELAEVPELVTSTMHMVAGLLLPIWRRLPEESTHVYRLQTDDGERVIGRRVSPAWVASTLGDQAPKLSADQVWQALTGGSVEIHLAEGHVLKQVRAMGTPRIELTGFNDLGVDRLKSVGLISEIVSWKLRLFVPTGAEGPNILARLIERYPLERVVERQPARAA